MNTTVNFRTLGCRLNQSESDALQFAFQQHGYTIVPPDQAADISIVNSCAVTHQAEAKTRGAISAAHRMAPDGKIVVMGCYSHANAQQLLAMDGVRLVLGNCEKYQLLEHIEQLNDSDHQIIASPFENHDTFAPMGYISAGAHTRPHIKIQDGCSYYCAYCIIPYLRGPTRSRAVEDCVREAQKLDQKGFHEVVLTGINIGTYRSAQGQNITDVVEAILASTNLARIRISSIEPNLISDSLIGLVAHEPRVCRHLHIPLQNGSDRVLQAMKRRYTTAEFQSVTEKIFRENEDVCIGTDVMVGFPGESQDDFNAMRSFIERLPLSYLHVFRYSPRPGTAAASREDDVPFATKKERSAILRQISNAKRRRFHQGFLYQTEEVLWEQQDNDGRITGLTDHFIRVKAAGKPDLINRCIPTKLLRIKPGYMEGKTSREY